MDSYQKSLDLIREGSSPKGFLASVQDQDNYQRVWTRDGVVTGLAALLSGEQDLIETFKDTLQTVFDKQHPAGFIPSNVDLSGNVSYGGTVGRVDNGCWAIIGLANYCLFSDDNSLFSFYRSKIEKILHLLEAWEFNGKHLVYMPQSADWADEYIPHGYSLFIQLLRVWALRLSARITGQQPLMHKADKIIEIIKKNYWPSLATNEVTLYSPNLRHQLSEASHEYWLMGFNPSRIYTQFDLQANSLVLLLNTGSQDQEDRLLKFIGVEIRNSRHLMPSFIPTILEKDQDFNELKGNFAYSFRNRPFEFHNGGLWPVWNGFLSAALKSKKESELSIEVLNRLEEAVNLRDFEFNECLNGESFLPVGVKKCVWSASGLVIANAYQNNKTLFFS